MAWSRGIRVSVVRRKGLPTLDGCTPDKDNTNGKSRLPEFPHPESSSIQILDPRSQHDVSNSTDQSSTPLSSHHIPKIGAKTSCYIPSDPGTQFGIEWAVDRSTEVHRYMYFILFINGRRVVSWGADLGCNNEGIIEFALYEPSDKWFYSDQGLILKRGGIEKRYFYFGGDAGATSAAGDGGLVEVQAFRSTGNQKRSPAPQEYRQQDKYGVLCPSGGLVESPKDFAYYKWVLVEPNDSPYATFRFYYRSWNSLHDLNLIRAPSRQAASPAKTGGYHQSSCAHNAAESTDFDFMLERSPPTVLVLDDDFQGSQSHEEHDREIAPYDRSSLDALKHPPVIFPVTKAQPLPQPSKMTSETQSDMTQRPLPDLPMDMDMFRRHSITSRSSASSRAVSVTPSLLPYLDDLSDGPDEVEFGVANPVSISSIQPTTSNVDEMYDPSMPNLPQACSPSIYSTSPPSETSELPSLFLQNDYTTTSESVMQQQLQMVVSEEPSADRLKTDEMTAKVVHVMIPEEQWIKRNEQNRTPSPLRRRRTQARLSQFGGDDLVETKLSST